MYNIGLRDHLIKIFTEIISESVWVVYNIEPFFKEINIIYAQFGHFRCYKTCVYTSPHLDKSWVVLEICCLNPICSQELTTI